MLWSLCSLFFCWLAFRELRGARSEHRSPEPLYLPYLLLVLGLAAACAWPPLQAWRFERFLEARATRLADGRPASVHCNTVIDSIFDQHMLAGGHANPRTGEIVIQKPWCEILRDYLDAPDRAGEREIISLNLFTHEAMHIRGELNEAVTECQAVQRNVRAARMLGVPDPIAKAHARRYYEELYALRAQGSDSGRHYHSAECFPGGALDERLPDSTWAP
jgi:hypothetical protein